MGFPYAYIQQHPSFCMHDTETRDMLADLVWLNAVIATELIQITENSRNPPQIRLLREVVLQNTMHFARPRLLLRKYRPDDACPTSR